MTTNSKLITDNPSFNNKDLQLEVDEHTLLLYHFDENFNTFTFDSTQNDNNGILFSRNLWYTFSPFKSSVFFSQKNYLTIPDLPNDSFSRSKLNISKALTVEMIFFLQNNQEDDKPVLLSKYNNLEKEIHTYAFLINNLKSNDIVKNQDLYWILSFKNKKNLALNLTIPWDSLTNSWHYLVGTYDGFESRVYLDGRLMNKVKYVDILDYSPLPIFLAKNASDSGFCNFIIDELRISNIARSKKAIQDYWKSINKLLSKKY